MLLLRKFNQIRKIWKYKMRAFLFYIIINLLLLSSIKVYSNEYFVFQKLITLSNKDAPLDKIFIEIERQSSYRFVYNNKQIKMAKPVTVYINNGTIDEALNICFKGQPLTYSIVNELIVVREKIENDNGKEKNIFVQKSALIDIKGRVTNETGEPLAGVTITIKGSRMATVSNSNGEFTVSNINNDAVLIFSGANIETYNLNVMGRTSLAIKLVAKISKLDDVQVIAYGTTTQRVATGNITLIKGEDIVKQPVNNPLLALEGRVPGLFITQSSGIPGASVIVRIQGTNSINSGNDPFYVVDGVPFPQSLGSTGAAFAGGILGVPSPLSYINPNDIESIEVLKDADATAIYGSRAANGAILITTKKAKASPMKLELNLQQGTGQVSRKMDLLNTSQYLEMRREAFRNDGLSLPSFATNSANTDYDVNGVWDTTRNTDWQKILIGGRANYSNFNVSLSGGNSITQYLVGGTYHKETSVFPGDYADKSASLHFSINSVSVNQKIFFQLTGSYLSNNNQLPRVDLTPKAITLPPDAPPLLKIDGTLNWAPNPLTGNTTWLSSIQPLAYTRNYYQNKTSNLISNMLIGYHIIPGLDIKTNLGYTNLQAYELGYNPISAIAPEKQATTSRTAVYSNSMVNSLTIEPQIDYKQNIRNGKFEALVGSTFYENTVNGQALSGSGYTSDALLGDIRSATTISASNTSSFIYKYAALFGRITYNFKDKYIINLTSRRDGSSRFGDANKFHDFGAIGAAWVFSKEKWAKESLAFVSFGKIRGSYGTTGNDQITNYLYYDLYSTNSVGVAYQGTQGLRVNSLYNPYLQWEETQKMQFGLDVGFLSDRILFTANYINNKSSNELLSYILPSISGFSSITKNFSGTVQNSGWEFVLNTINVKSKYLTWTSSINLTSEYNKLLYFPNLSSASYFGTLIVGQPINVIKLYHLSGFDSNTGLYYFADNKGVPTLSPNSISDKTTSVTTNPKYYGGFQNTISYKGFQLDVLFQFVRQLGQEYYFLSNYAGTKLSNQPTNVLKRWQMPGDKTLYPYFTTNSYGTNPNYANSVFNYTQSDAYYTYNASFIRLKNVSISYQIPIELIRKLGFKYCVIFSQGQNLFTRSKYKGLDPENQNLAALPPLKVLTFGLRAGF